MIQRAARAIYKIDYPDDHGDVDEFFWDRHRECYLAQARAAIAAAREPTIAMTIAGRAVAEVDENGFFNVDKVFAAMIDAAIGKTTP